jgi:hypothetical protein
VSHSCNDPAEKQEWLQRFVDWYNYEQKHSRIIFLRTLNGMKVWME